MVKLTYPVIGLALVLPTAIAAPKNPPPSLAFNVRSDTFSREQWIVDIERNPEGDHLSADEALDAFCIWIDDQSSMRARCRSEQLALHVAKNESGQSRRKCIENLATFGNTDRAVNGPSPGQEEQVLAKSMSSEGSARITAYTLRREGTTSKHRDIARGLGQIMDECTILVHGVNKVRETGFAWGNGDFSHLHRALNRSVDGSAWPRKKGFLCL